MNLNVIRKVSWVGITLYFSFLMAKIVIPYFYESRDYGFLITKLDILHLSFYRLTFLIHVSSSLVIMTSGAFLFISISKSHWLSVHRFLGRIYVVLVLFLAAPSGLIMGYFANGGLMGQINFMLLSTIWWMFTYFGFKNIIDKNITAHKKWMIRSYALTLSAITLRVLQMTLPMTLFPDQSVRYVFISWGSWILNLMIAEIYIYIKINGENLFSFSNLGFLAHLVKTS